jgi:hypothetical protein
MALPLSSPAPAPASTGTHEPLTHVVSGPQTSTACCHCPLGAHVSTPPLRQRAAIGVQTGGRTVVHTPQVLFLQQAELVVPGGSTVIGQGQVTCGPLGVLATSALNWSRAATLMASVNPPQLHVGFEPQ